MRRVLIVSPHFPPVNAPDMQRVRLALPHLRAHGWEPTVLAVSPDRVEGAVLDPLLEQTFPADIRVCRVGGISPRLTRKFKVGNLWWRCGRGLRVGGERLLREGRFDLVFFSTTLFNSFMLGPRWRRQFGVPYVLDYQDPWVNDYYRQTGNPPPGGVFKYWLSQSFARRREPKVLRAAAGLIAVSSAYGPSLARRYPWFAADTVRTIPFGTSGRDLEIAREHQPATSLVPLGDGNIHHVYAGRGGADMDTALTLLFRSFRRFLETDPTTAQRMRFHFIGTDYAPPPLGKPTALPVAEREGVLPYVAEHCRRVPYFEALHYLVRADALLVVGSNDPTYSASKIFPYLFSRRPLLTIAHQNSLMFELAKAQSPAGTFGFGETVPETELVARIRQTWFVEQGYRQPPAGDPAQLGPHTAATMTARLARVFAESLERHR